MIVTATQIKIHGILGYFRFVPLVFKIQKQLSNIEGLEFVKFSGLKTLSGWKNKEAMLAFRNNGHHLAAMKNFKKMGEVKSITWEMDAEPDWPEAILKLQSVDYRN